MNFDLENQYKSIDELKVSFLARKEYIDLYDLDKLSSISDMNSI